MTELTESARTRQRFATLTALQDQHASLVKEVGKDLLTPENLARIEDFIRSAVAAGTILDSLDDRAAAQGLINFWTARLSSAVRTAGETAKAAAKAPRFEETLLEEFDSATISTATASADAWLQSLPEAEQALVRRIMLRLLRLHPDRPVFEPVPAVRGALYELGTPARVDAAIDGLVAAGVVRVRKGDSPEMDRVAIRSRELLTEWPLLKEWMGERLAFRERVAAWEKTKRPDEGLLYGDALEEVRAYHDRNEPERQFTELSRYRELRQYERNQVMKWVYGVGLLFALASLYVIHNRNSALSRANDELVVSRTAAQEAEKNARAAERITEDRAEGLAQRARLSTLRLLVRGLAEVAASRNPSERDLALARWTTLAGQLDKSMDVKGELGMDLDELGREAADPQNHNRLSQATLRAIREQRITRATGPETESSIMSMRDVSFEMVRVSARGAVKELRDGPFIDAVPYIKEFWTQYWGEMLLVEGKRVDVAMVRYGRVLTEIEDAVDQSRDDFVDRFSAIAKEHAGDDWSRLMDKVKAGFSKPHWSTLSNMQRTMQAIKGDVPDEALNKFVTDALEQRAPPKLVEKLEQMLKPLVVELLKEQKQEVPSYSSAEAL